MKVNERFIWAAAVLDLQPADRVLEIGCGAGILVEQMADYLISGSITAIDRSSAMIKMANKRNEALVSSAKVNLLRAEFADAIFKKAAFDKIAAFNINFFWKDSEREFGVIKKILKPNGRLFVFHQAPYNIDIEAALSIKEKLSEHVFEITGTIFKKMIPTPSFCVVAKPKR